MVESRNALSAILFTVPVAVSFVLPIALFVIDYINGVSLLAVGVAASSIVLAAAIIGFGVNRLLRSPDYVDCEDVKLEETVKEVLETREFKGYSPYRRATLGRFIREEHRIRREASPLRELATRKQLNFNTLHRETIRNVRRVTARRTFACSLVFCALSVASGGVIIELLAKKLGFVINPTVMSWCTVLAIATLAIWFVSMLVFNVRRSSVLQSARDQVAAACLDYRRAIEVNVADALRRALNDVLTKQGILKLSPIAPRLVELNTAEIRSSVAADQVSRFIEDHDSSAIGLAGFRGAGKSTIMRSIMEKQQLPNASTLVSAPVSHDPADFCRHILQKVAEEIVEQEPIRRGALGDRVTMTRFYGFVVAGMLGGLLLAGDALSAAWPKFGTTSVIGLTVLGYAVAGFYYTWLVRPRKLSYRYRSPVVVKASMILDELSYEIEDGAVAKNVLKLATFGELSDESSTKRKHRAMTRVDSASCLRDLLEDYCRQAGRPRFIVCVDELDKLPTADALVVTINNLKDLFHIDGVHFVVSVSIDALRSFEQRGLPDRDAFDSSFDTVIDVGWLTVKESQDVVTSRANGFHPHLAYYCHAWSGGLPRDLLRTARRCVEIQGAAQKPLRSAELITRLIQADLLQLIEGLLGSTSQSAAETLLWYLRGAVLEDARTGTIREQVDAVRKLRIHESHVINGAITRYCAGLYIQQMALLLHPVGEPAPQWAEEQVEQWFKLLASVTASTASDMRIQELRLDDCARALPLN